MEALETFEHAGLTVNIHRDSDVEVTNPRTNQDNLGVLVFDPSLHLQSEGDSNYELPADLSELTKECPVCEGEGECAGQAVCERCNGEGSIPVSVEEYFAEHYDAIAAVPVRHADYGSSGEQIYDTDSENANGVMYTTQALVDKLGVPADDVKRQLEAEIKEFGHWLEGEVYGYTITGPNGENLGQFSESCWGFIAPYGDTDEKSSWQYFLGEAKSAAEGVREALDEAKIEPSEVKRIEAFKRYAEAQEVEGWRVESLLANRHDAEAMIFSDVDVLRAILAGKVVPV